MIDAQLNNICEKYRVPYCHSDFQIANFIIGKETSNVGKLWQTIRELQARKDSLENINHEIEEVDDNIELAKIDVEKLQLKKIFCENAEIENLKIKKKNIIISKIKRKIKRLEKSKLEIIQKKEDLHQEISMFIQIFEALSKTTNWSEFNNPQAQNEYWNKKFETELNMCSVLGTPISADLIRSVLALPDNSNVKKQVLEAITNVNKKLLGQNN